MPHQLKNILYIEDDTGLAVLLKKRLQTKGFMIDIAETGSSGLQSMQDKKYDLVLLDHFLPDMTGLNILEKVVPEDHCPPIILLTASGDERIAVEALERGAADYAVKDVDQFYIDLLPAVMQAAHTRYRLMHENRQQREDLDEARKRAEAANQAKSEFLATMSHEIRTPLNVILGISDLFEKTQLNEKQTEMISVLRTNASLLHNIVNDMLDISRIESGQMVLDYNTFHMASILNNTKIMFAGEAEKRNIQLFIEDNTVNIEWFGGELRVQQIMMNLASNAIKFTDKGHVRVAAHKVNDKGSQFLEVSIEDTGIGIAKDKLSAIFSKFVQADQSITRRFGGSGLGLALSRSFAQMMNGTIIVDSVENKGSTFTVRLGLSSRIVEQQKSEPDTSLLQRNNENKEKDQNRKVLLVEDYPANIMIATMMLEDMDFTVTSAVNGQEAVDAVAQADMPYDVILMDIQMQGMDGYEATRQIRNIEKEKGFNHLIIGATAHALAGDREKCLECGMNDYTSKPIDWAELAGMMSV